MSQQLIPLSIKNDESPLRIINRKKLTNGYILNNKDESSGLLLTKDNLSFSQCVVEKNEIKSIFLFHMQTLFIFKFVQIL